VLASIPSPVPSRLLPKDSNAPFRFFFHFTKRRKNRAITATVATLPTTPPTTAEVDTLGAEPEAAPFPAAPVLEVAGLEVGGVPPEGPVGAD